MKRYFLLSLIASASLFLTSCLKDKNVENKVYGMNGVEDIKLVELGFNKNPTSPAGAIHNVYTPITLDPVAQAQFDVTVNLASGDVAPNDVKVEIGVDPNLVTEYNSSQNTSYNTLPASTYSLPTSVTIPAGQRSATFTVTLKPNQFDASKQNVLPIYIKSTSYGTVSGNFGSAILSLPVKSIWDGTYTVTVMNNYGTLDPNIGADPYVAQHVSLTTVGPNLLRTQYVAQTYSGYTEYQFNGNNTSITKVNAFSGSLRATSVDQIIEVDPGKVFELRWTFLGRGIRERYVRE